MPNNLGLTRETIPRIFVKTFQLNQRKGNVTVQKSVVRQVDFLFAALTQKFLYLVVLQMSRVLGRRLEAVLVVVKVLAGLNFDHIHYRILFHPVKPDHNHIVFSGVQTEHIVPKH